MATNYFTESKSVVRSDLQASSLPSNIITKILSGLGSTVKGVEFDNHDLSHPPTGTRLNGSELVLIDPNGSVDLSSISKASINGVDAIVFTTDEDVNFTLSGANTLSFKGVVTTNAGDDAITLNSKVGVTVSSGDGNDTVNTGAGNDSVLAGSGDDSVTTGAGNDSVSAGAGNDTVVTGTGNDTVLAGAGNDSINTGAGNDSVSTGSGNDTVTTEGGNDSVYVGSGNDTVNTGAGNDIVKLAAGFSGNAALDGGAGVSDRLDLSHVVITDVAQVGTVLTITLDDNSVITATNFEKIIYDNSTADVDGGVVIVGVNQFVNHDFSG
jgi:Ca2+-binding RTX toxin-like protein